MGNKKDRFEEILHRYFSDDDSNWHVDWLLSVVSWVQQEHGIPREYGGRTRTSAEKLEQIIKSQEGRFGRRIIDSSDLQWLVSEIDRLRAENRELSNNE